MKASLRLALISASLILCSALPLLAQAPITVYPNPIQFGTVALNSTSYSVYVYVENSTSTAVNITSITISGTNSSDFTITSPACVGTIPGDSYCEMTMTFTPSAMGSLSANLLISVSGVTSPESFTLEGAGGNPIPSVTSISPDSIYENSPTTTVTVNGTGFLASSSASIQEFPTNSTLATTYVSSTQLKVQIPASFLTQSETETLYVTNPAPAGGSGSNTFQVVSPTPDLTSVSPSWILAGTSSSPIVLTGSNFMTGAKVEWNGVAIPTTYVNSGELQATPTTADLATPGIVQLSVANPSPGTISEAVTFDVTYPATITVLDLPANDLVWDPFAQLIYASMPSSYGENGNSIAVINPSTGAVTGYHFAGSEPTKLALSATSSYLYVGLNGNGSVQRLDLPGFTKDIEVNLGTDEDSGPYVAGDLKVSPSDTHTYAVALDVSNECCGYSTGPLVFYTDSTKLADSVTGEFNQILFPTGSTLYAYTSGSVNEVAVTSTGGTLGQEWYDLVEGNQIQYAAGLIYGGDGQSFNPGMGTLVGTYDVGSNGNSVLPDSAISRVFAVGTTPFFNSLGVTAYNLADFTPIAVTSLAEFGSSPYGNVISNAIQWGSNGLAFALQAGCCGNVSTQTVLVQSPTMFLTAAKNVNPQPTVKSLTPAAAPRGSGNFILTVKGSDFVPGSTVTWNSKSVFAEYLDSAELRVYVPGSHIASSGTASISVKNPEPGGGKSNAALFTIK
jgi:trimeric autotransporter adhesin